MSDGSKKSVARSLGEFVGHIWHGVKTDPSAPKVRQVRREVEEQQCDSPRGKVTLRRTTIEEVELNDDQTR